MIEQTPESQSPPATGAMRIAWDEFVYGGHMLALGDAVTLYVLALVLNIPITWDFLVIIYLCVFTANLYNRSEESGHDAAANPARARVMAKYTKHLTAISVISLAVVAVLLLRFANLKVLLFAGLIFGISMLYTVVFKGITKYIVGFKSYVAALFYSLMVFLLVFYYSAPVNLAVLLVFAFYFIRIFLSNAVCDFKDVESDKKRGLKTLVINNGEQDARRILSIVNVLSGLLLVYGVYVGVLPAFSLALLLTIPYAAYYLRPTTKVSQEAWSGVVVDGEFLFWLPYVLILKAVI